MQVKLNSFVRLSTVQENQRQSQLQDHHAQMFPGLIKQNKTKIKGQK
jgi:hypothetical protein